MQYQAQAQVISTNTQHKQQQDLVTSDNVTAVSKKAYAHLCSLAVFFIVFVLNHFRYSFFYCLLLPHLTTGE
jgi:hypothetical protein